jgi:hypothetical protein
VEEVSPSREITFRFVASQIVSGSVPEGGEAQDGRKVGKWESGKVGKWESGKNRVR